MYIVLYSDIDISGARKNSSNTHLKLNKFVSKIKIRNEHDQLSASVRLSYDLPSSEPKRILSFHQAIGRRKDIFPIADQNIKKMGD